MTIVFLSVLIISTATLALANTTTGLLAWWKFEEGAGVSVIDSSGKGNTGDLTGHAPAWVGGCIRNNCLNFDGSASYVNLSSVNNLTAQTPLSITAWVYPTSLASASFGGGVGGTIIDANENGAGVGYVLGIRNTNKVWWWPFGGADLFSTGSVSLNTWTHIAVTYANNTLKMYINGALDSSQAGSDPNVPTFYKIGARSWITGWFAGNIDDVRVYSRALSAQDVYMLYLSDNKFKSVNLRNYRASN